MVDFISLPGSREFLYAANDNGKHRPPPFQVVMKARQQLAEVRKQRIAALTHAHNS
jgi:hypothetical protein